jgi:hypothetical protein
MSWFATAANAFQRLLLLAETSRLRGGNRADQEIRRVSAE